MVGKGLDGGEGIDRLERPKMERPNMERPKIERSKMGRWKGGKVEKGVRTNLQTGKREMDCKLECRGRLG